MVPGWSKRGSVNSYMGTVGPPGGIEGGGGGQNRFSKNLIFERFAAKFFSKVSRGFSEGQKECKFDF